MNSVARVCWESKEIEQGIKTAVLSMSWKNTKPILHQRPKDTTQNLKP